MQRERKKKEVGYTIMFPSQCASVKASVTVCHWGCAFLDKYILVVLVVIYCIHQSRERVKNPIQKWHCKAYKSACLHSNVDFSSLTHTKVQPSDKRQWVTGMLIRFCRNCFIIIRFAAHSLYFENNLWSLVAGWLYLTVQVNMGPQIWRLPSRLSLRGDIS